MLPAVYGHEAAGVVNAVGPGVAGITPGARVVVSLLRSCGECFFCRRGESHLCDHEFPADRASPLRTTHGEAVSTGCTRPHSPNLSSSTPLSSRRCRRRSPSTSPRSSAAESSRASARSPTVRACPGVERARRRYRRCRAEQRAGCGAPRRHADRGRRHLIRQAPGGAAVRSDARRRPRQRRPVGGRPLRYRRPRRRLRVRHGRKRRRHRGNASVRAPRRHARRRRHATLRRDVPGRGGRSRPQRRADPRKQDGLRTSRRRRASAGRALYERGELLLDELITGRYPLERINDAIAAARGGEAIRNIVVLGSE